MSAKTRGSIPDYIENNFKTIQLAAAAGGLAVISAIRIADQQNVFLLATVHKDEDNMVCITPFAEMIDGNPFEMYEDPTKDDENGTPH